MIAWSSEGEVGVCTEQLAAAGLWDVASGCGDGWERVCARHLQLSLDVDTRETRVQGRPQRTWPPSSRHRLPKSGFLDALIRAGHDTNNVYPRLLT